MNDKFITQSELLDQLIDGIISLNVMLVQNSIAQGLMKPKYSASFNLYEINSSEKIEKQKNINTVPQTKDPQAKDPQTNMLHALCFKIPKNNLQKSSAESILHILLKFGYSPNEIDQTGKMPLHIATLGSNYNFVKTLSNSTRDINQQDCSGNTPLHFSVICKNLEAFKALIDLGAVTTIKNNKDKTVLNLIHDNSWGEANDYLLQKIKNS